MKECEEGTAEGMPREEKAIPKRVALFLFS
jgi:hypothetical protein